MRRASGWKRYPPGVATIPCIWVSSAPICSTDWKHLHSCRPPGESFLEYELASMVYALSQPNPPRVGLISGLPISGGFDMQTRQPRDPWSVYDQINDRFDVETIEPTATELPDDIDALVVIHPRELTEALMREIDAFVLAGGRLLAFVDPYAETDPGQNPEDPMAAMSAERDSSLDPLFEAWGIEYDRSTFVADLGQALQVSVQQGRSPVRHPAIIGVGPDHLNREDVTTAELESIQPGQRRLVPPERGQSADAGAADSVQSSIGSSGYRTPAVPDGSLRVECRGRSGR